MHRLHSEKYGKVHHELTLGPDGTKPELRASTDHVAKHEVQRVLELARPLRDQTTDLTSVPTKEPRCRLLAAVPRLIREQPLEVRVIRVRKFQRVLLAPRLVMLRERVGHLLQRVDHPPRRDQGLLIADLAHERLDVPELPKRRPPGVP